MISIEVQQPDGGRFIIETQFVRWVSISSLT